MSFVQYTLSHKRICIACRTTDKKLWRDKSSVSCHCLLKYRENKGFSAGFDTNGKAENEINNKIIPAIKILFVWFNNYVWIIILCISTYLLNPGKVNGYQCDIYHIPTKCWLVNKIWVLVLYTHYTIDCGCVSVKMHVFRDRTNK